MSPSEGAPPRLLLIGAGGHGRAVLSALRDAGWPEPIGVLDDGGAALPGVPCLGPVSHAAALRPEAAAAHVALGSNALRMRLGAELLALGFALPVIRHPSAVIAADAVLGPGTVAMPRVVVGAAARIGAHVILNTACIAEHDCAVEDGCHIAPGAVLGGGVFVGEGALVGIQAGLRPGTRVGAGAVVALGAAVVADVPPRATVAGVPARMAAASRPA
ncbi:NeuD/PglB/VioB family sugar acetyltransferase [Pseudoroseomonas globiformis]|uniref:NeuD/PglB/VioB family sugar acetyltransferase n=1 Tax=Teichococcus globiformis TaxID=2307229 RepID=A0ABV7G2H1_9PROT